MKAIKPTALVLAGALLMAPTQVTANKLDDNRPWIIPYQVCETLAGSNYSVKLCNWDLSKTILPDRKHMTKIINIVVEENLEPPERLDTVVMIEPADTLSTRYWGFYLPATGNIIVTYPFDDDKAMLMHTIAHELLHAMWDMRGVDMSLHHPWMYCDGALDSVQKYLETFVDPFQTPKVVERKWVSLWTKLSHCGGELDVPGPPNP